MKPRMSAACAITLAALMPAAPVHARAPMEFKWDTFPTMADRNMDGMVRKNEFLDAMGQMDDTAMTGMKTGPKMVEGD